MNKLAIRTRKSHDITILDISGELTAGYGARALDRMLRRLDIESRLHVLLNFTSVTRFDEKGMNVLVDCRQHHMRGDNHVKVFGIDKQQGNMKTDMLTLSHLLTFFDVFEDEASAVASFNQQDDDLSFKRASERKKVRDLAAADQVASQVYDDEGGRFPLAVNVPAQN